MLLESIKIDILEVPLAKPITTNLHTLTKSTFIALSIHTSVGITGESLIYGLGKTSPISVCAHIENDLIPLIKQQQLLLTSTHWQQFWHQANTSTSMAWRYALAAIDIAVWDILAKNKAQPLYQLLGGKQLSIPIYNTNGWLSYSMDELLEECL